MSKLEKIVLDATGIKPARSGEDRQKFLLRAMLAVQKLPSDDWETLDQAIQDWYNAAVEADNADKPVPEFPDAAKKAKAAAEEEVDDAADEDAAAEDDGDEEDDGAADDEEESDEEEAEQEEEVKQSKTSKKGAAAAKPKKPEKKPEPRAAKKAASAAGKKNGAAPPPKKAAKAGAAPAKKGTSMRRALKMIVIKKPKIATEDLIDALEKKGYKSPSKLTVTSIRADTRDTIKVLNEAGLTTIEL